MAQITITIPDDKIQDVLDAFADNFGYDSESGKTKAQFAKGILITWIKREYLSWKGDTAKASSASDLDAVD